MLKALARWVVGVGVSPRFLLTRVAALRALDRLPGPRSHTSPTEASQTIERVFFSFPYHSVGDLTLSLTLLDRVHDLWPSARIDVAVGASMGPLVDAIPYVNRTFRLKRSTLRHPRIAAYEEIHNATRLFQKEIAGTPYDLAIAPRWDSFDSFFSAHLAYLTGATIRCGYSGTADGGSAEVDRFYTTAGVGGAGEHETVRYTKLLARCGLEAFNAVDERTPQHGILALQAVAASRKDAGTAMPAPVSGRYAVLSPGATKAWHRWPVDRFAEVGRALCDQFKMRTVVIGSRQDAPLCAELSDRIGPSALSMAGKTDALQMVDLIAASSLFLGNDSGPAHLAGGLDISTIVINPHPVSCPVNHQNAPSRWKPAGRAVEMLQPSSALAPCTEICQHPVAHCILQVSTDEVLASAEKAVLELSNVEERLCGS